MIELPKPSVEEIVYRAVTYFCIFGFVASVIAFLVLHLVMSRMGIPTASQNTGFSMSLWLFGVLFILASCFSGRRLGICEQRRRDASASIRSNAAEIGEKAQSAVFLRPFYTTNKIKVEVSTGMRWNSLYAPYSYAPQRFTYDLEATLINALLMPVDALGRPGEVDEGVGRILTTEDSWKSKASALMRQASVIICIPSDQPGSRWELDEILRNQYLEKTVFLMPCEPTPPLRHLRADWNAVVAYMASHGFRIPPYDQKGLLFAIRPTIGCFIEALNLASSKELGDAIRRLSRPNRRFDTLWQESQESID